MTTTSDHRPVVQAIRLRVPSGSHAIPLSSETHGAVALRAADGWRVTIRLQRTVAEYAISLERGVSELTSVPVKARIPLYGGRGSIRFWWDEEKLEVQVRLYGEWVTVEDDTMWELAFGPVRA